MNFLILQARMGSSRLPGKAMKDVAGQPLLSQIVQRLSRSRHACTPIVATTNNAADDVIEAWCNQHQIKCYRGSEQDVLSRFYEAATTHGAQSGDTIIRICCDNPLHSHKVLDFALDEFYRLGVDYFSNSNQEPLFLEDGFDVEVTTFDALAYACQHARLSSEREHVMPFIKNCGRFKLAWRKAHGDYHHKLSVDTEDDLRAVNALFKRFENQPDFSIEEVVDLLRQHPEIRQLNAASEINSGYKKSLAEDKPYSP
ncbi:MAG: glycosyltransferase family protein [Flavobacteriales bacterium]|nr:glycosyltransferase family protein [Flavobacteriales bacterium]